MQNPANLLSDLPKQRRDEVFEKLIDTESCTIERIVSRGHTTEEGKWYDQEKNEWVLIIKGAARLRFADRETAFEMRPGDHINIPAHCKHRVEWTDPDVETVWVAVHYE